MEIISTAVYVGPNVYAKLPLIRLTVDLHRRAETPVSEYADVLIGPLLRAAARPRHRRDRAGHAAGRAPRSDPDCRLGELMAQVAVALQNRAGAPAEVALDPARRRTPTRSRCSTATNPRRSGSRPARWRATSSWS